MTALLDPRALVVGPELVQRVVEQHALSNLAPRCEASGLRRATFGIHGVGHWARVLLNGMLLAEHTGASPRVVQLFALFHDAARIHDGNDPQHGFRGAELARARRGEWFQASDAEMDSLWDACVYHSEGTTDHPDVSVQTCWDADRLDLSRLSITPDKRYLSTAAAKGKALREAAVRRGNGREIPSFVAEVWGIESAFARSGGRGRAV